MARYLGIEVTDGQVKGVVVRAAYRKLVIEQVERVGRASGAEGLEAAARELVARVGAGIDAVYAALPGAEVSMRLVELPRAVARRGIRMVAQELDGSLPFDIEDAVIDAQLVRSGETVEMLAAAARTDRVREFVATLRAAGIEPREVGVGPIAMGELANAVSELASGGPLLILHAYESRADFTVLAGGVVQMARTLGGQTSPQARARGIRQTLGAHLAAGGEPPIAAYLCGEHAEENRDVVASVLGLDAEAVSTTLPLGSLELGPALVPPNAPQLAPLALAMALRGMGRGHRVDLRRGELAVSRGAQVLRERARLLGASLGAIVLAWGFATATQYFLIASERDRLREALGRVSQEALGQRVTDPARAIALARGGGPGEQDPLPQADALDVIGVLSTRIPDSVRHDITQLTVTDEHVQVQGVVDSLQALDTITQALSEYPCFQNIQRGQVQRNPGDERQQYTLDIELRCPAAGGERRPASGARNTNGSTRSSQGGSHGGAI